MASPGRSGRDRQSNDFRRHLPDIPARAAAKILDAARARGVAAGELCAAAGLAVTTLDDPETRIPFASVVALYEQGARLTGDSAFGLHVGEQSSPAMFDVLGYVTMNSPTFGEALARLVRYQRVWTEGALFHLTIDQRTARLVYEYQIGDYGRGERHQDCEGTLAIVVSGIRAVAGAGWRPHEVWFEHASPEDTSEHRRIFDAPLRFGQPGNALLMDRSIVDLPIASADPRLVAVLERHAEELLARLPSCGGFVDAVRQAAGEAMTGGEPELGAIARRLGLSTRTLQRRLEEHGTSLQDLLEEMRRDLAIRYLAQPDITISAVAYLLGFSEPSTFHRAFRRWTGTTPGDYRRRMRPSE
jgi:AraC-like DNA-binding protein